MPGYFYWDWDYPLSSLPLHFPSPAWSHLFSRAIHHIWWREHPSCAHWEHDQERDTFPQQCDGYRLPKGIPNLPHNTQGICFKNVIASVKFGNHLTLSMFRFTNFHLTNMQTDKLTDKSNYLTPSCMCMHGSNKSKIRNFVSTDS